MVRRLDTTILLTLGELGIERRKMTDEDPQYIETQDIKLFFTERPHLAEELIKFCYRRMGARWRLSEEIEARIEEEK